MKDLEESRNIYKIVLLVSIACVLQVAESMLPQPIPGMRIGLANMMTLVALDSLGFAFALEVAFFRTVLSSLMMGTFLSFPFILSFSGALASALVMGFLFWLAGSRRMRNLSMVGISIIGALSHTLVQLGLVYFLLVKHKGVFIFLPWLCAAAIIAGWITGVIAANICRKIKEKQGTLKEEEFIVPLNIFQTVPGSFPGNYGIKDLAPARMKIVIAAFLILPALFADKLLVYAGLFLALSAIILFLRLPLGKILASLKKYPILTVSAFLLPVFFNSGNLVLFNALGLKVTAEGLHSGIIFALRLNFLVLVSAFVLSSAPVEEIMFVLARFFKPMRIFGISERKIAVIFSLSWLAIPAFLEAAKNILRENKLKKTKRLRDIVTQLSDFVAALFLEGGKSPVFVWAVKSAPLMREAGQGNAYKNTIESTVAERV